MSYPPPPYGYPQQQPPQRDPAITFMGMSGGVLMLAVAVVILLPIAGCVGCCLLGGVGAIINPQPTPSPF